MSTGIVQLKRKLKNCKSQLTRIENFIRDNDNIGNFELVQIKYENLLEQYTKYKELQNDIGALDSEDTAVSDTDELAESQTLDRFELALSNLRGFVNNLKVSINPANNHISNEASSVKLPEIKIKPFEGHAQEWPSFFDLFTSLVLKNPQLKSESEKFYYLKSLLRGQPLALIESLNVTNQNLEIALDTLKSNYEDKNKLLNSLYQTLLDQKPIIKCNPNELREFYITCKKTLDLIRNLNLSPEVAFDTLIVFLLEKKVDYQSRRAFEIDRDLKTLPSTEEFLEFLKKRYTVLENLNIFEPSTKHPQKVPHKVNLYANIDKPQTTEKRFSNKACNYCNDRAHTIYKCQKFASLNPHEKHRFVKSKSLCFNCLSNLHSISACKSTSKCQICNKNHHTLIHLDQSQSRDTQERVQVNSQPSQNSNTTPQVSNERNPSHTLTSLSAVNKNSLVLLPTAQVKVYTRNGEPLFVKAILDSGSQQSFCTKTLVEKLQRSTRSQKLDISGLGQNYCTQSTEVLVIQLHSIVNPFKSFNISCSVIDKITDRLPQISLDPHSLEIPEEFKNDLADPHFWEPNEIHILIGADLYFKLAKGEVIRLIPDGLTLMNTELGYIIAGLIQDPKSRKNAFRSPQTYSFLSIQNEPKENDTTVENLLEKFWEIEEIHPQRARSEDEDMAEKLFQSTTQILESGRYQVQMPLIKNDNIKLGNSYTIAKRRFLYLENKFKNNSDLFKEYERVIEEYLALGHAKIVPLSLYDNVLNEIKYFIPHRAVIREQSLSTKLRVVYDFSAKTTSGYSLNYLTLKGYQVQDNLLDILCRFRTFKFILTADIQMMYRMIEMAPVHRHLQNILWRDSPSEELKCIELSRLSFGQNCSPFLATRVLKDIAQNNSQSPLVMNALISQTYMDDILAGTDNFSDLTALYMELNTILKKHGFYLHKWCSNSSRFLEEISNSNMKEVDLNLEDTACKILGLKWDPHTDNLKISANYAFNSENITKRKILSYISSCFDPLGIVNPLIVNGKILMQELWQLKLSWDETITDPQILRRWEMFKDNLARIHDLSIPRFVFSSSTIRNISIHGFADASQMAYGACIYLVASYTDNSRSSNLFTAKSRVAPIKNKLTIPRLELCAMELLAKLIDKTLSILANRLKIDSVNAWSDSQVALSYIKNSPNKYNVFVANRIVNIRTLSNNVVWRHINTKLNPADTLSRGIFNNSSLSLWFHGPEFLCDSEFDFDKNNTFSLTDNLPETKKISLVVTKDSTNMWISMFARFSKFSKLQNAVAYLFRFIRNLKYKENKTQGVLTREELSRAHEFIIKSIQAEYFSKEIASLSSNKPIVQKQLLALNPFVDAFGILRVGGRLVNAQAEYNQKFPILLPANNHVVSLLIEKEHCRLGHSGAQNVLSNLRLRYWPLNGVKHVKKIIKRCITCYRFNAQTATQIMSPLPVDRLHSPRAFYKTGVDFAVPLHIRASRLRKAQVLKCYFAIFICMATKAVHIEIVSDLSTNAFLAALKRFIARRGNPHTMYSDNGTNFIGANNQLKELYNFFKSTPAFDDIKLYLAQNETQWKFIPPRSPHWGGLWESAVKSTKYHLVRLMGNTQFTFEELYTVLTQIESILNSRPLYPLSSDPNDLQPLTPGHFLIGTAMTAYPDIDVTETPVNRLTFWKQCTQIQQSFWKRWSVDYLNHLQHRPKWLKPASAITVNDLVLVKSEDSPPLRWPLARVLETIPGKDGKVRVVRLKTAHGEYLRPITKLIPLLKPET